MIRLEQYLNRGTKRLRMGYTTGTCAAGAAGAAAQMLLGAPAVPAIFVQTPMGIRVELEVEQVWRTASFVRCAVRKDAGDDPDITDGLLVFAEVSLQEQGVSVEAGEGVGMVTRPGLACPVGAPAINPVPMRMILHQLQEAGRRFGYEGGLHAVISVPGGESVAARTFNPRLGIEGGISILGTSGIVEPMSRDALLDTIRLEIRSQKARGIENLLIAPGNYGMDYVAQEFGVSPEVGVKCSNFIGDALDIASAEGFGGIVLLGHAGKLVKLAGGIFHTHSRVADGRMEILCAHGGLCGIGSSRLKRLMDCVSVDSADALLVEWGAAQQVWESVAGSIQKHLKARAAAQTEVEFGLFAARGMLARSPGLDTAIRKIRSASGGGGDR